VSVLMAWVFIGTRGSVLATALTHFMFNTCLDVTHQPQAYYTTGVLVAAAALVALFARNMDTAKRLQLRARRATFFALMLDAVLLERLARRALERRSRSSDTVSACREIKVYATRWTCLATSSIQSEAIMRY